MEAKSIRNLLQCYYDWGIRMAINDPPLQNLQSERIRSHPSDNCQTLEELLQCLKTFDGCELKKGATQLVFADGNPQAKVMLIGEAPGAEEDRLGLPFVGLSGKLLDRMFASIGLDRQNSLYITNVVFWRPPGNRQPTGTEIAFCEPFVHKHIALIAPRLLVFLGGVAAKASLHTTEGIIKLRGRWHDYHNPYLVKPIPALATFHPAYLLRSPGQKALVWQDLLQIQKALQEQ